jgi:hypothetical protein
MQAMTVEPKDFIRGPYLECPRCGEEGFGLWIVGDHHYYRRCKICLHLGQLQPLPDLSKKVIYIDQFAVSNMMKALNPRTKAHKKDSLDPFFGKLFELLHQLCRMQLIICPTSFFHTWESLPSGFFQPLEECYELLSCGVKFYDSHTIRRFQLAEHAANWLKGDLDGPFRLDVRGVVAGRINSWPPVFQVKVNIRYSRSLVEELINWRNKSCGGLAGVFKRWRREPHKQFDDWFNEESSSYGIETLKGYLDFAKELIAELAAGGMMKVPPESVTTVNAVQKAFEEAGVPATEILMKSFEYFLSPEIKQVPSVKISSMLYAAIARKAAAGQKRPPSRGMATDVEAISVLLPYCDAMFVDKECHALLRERPLCDSIDYGTLVFSLNNKQDFLDYLNRIETEASELLLSKVTELYGS